MYTVLQHQTERANLRFDDQKLYESYLDSLKNSTQKEGARAHTQPPT